MYGAILVAAALCIYYVARLMRCVSSGVVERSKFNEHTVLFVFVIQKLPKL